MPDWLPRHEWLAQLKSPRCVIVTVAEGMEATATPISVDFEGWQSFRHWVEMSDPGCGQILNPPVASGP